MDAMKFAKMTSLILIAFVGSTVLMPTKDNCAKDEPSNRISQRPAEPRASQLTDADVIIDTHVQLCQGYDQQCTVCQGQCNGRCEDMVPGFGRFGHDVGPGRMLQGVDQDTCTPHPEARWSDAKPIPWEAFGYGEYIGPHRVPDVGEYRLRVNDVLELVYLLTREQSVDPYQLYVGDIIQLNSAVDASLNQTNVTLLPDGTVSLALIGQVRAAGKTVANLQAELNEKYKKFVKNPAIIVQVTSSETPLKDLLNSVDARFGQGGQGRQATVAPDGTIQLPLVGNIPAIGLTLNEIGREINARYRQKLRGIEVTPVLNRRAPRFIYVVGEVGQPGRFELTGPTTAMQAVALAGGFGIGGNIRQIVVFRRDHNWRLTATKLDLQGALFGKSPQPSDEIWLRDSDIVLIPKTPIQRLSEAVTQYFTNTIYRVYPQQALFDFDNATIF
jgi:polysaccharide export outer membrane protein